MPLVKSTKSTTKYLAPVPRYNASPQNEKVQENKQKASFQSNTKKEDIYGLANDSGEEAAL